MSGKKSEGSEGQGTVKAADILSSRFFGSGVVVIYVLVGFVLYSNVLHGPFVFDDSPNIVENPHIRVTELSLEELRDAGFKSVMPTRPVANISFALNYYIHGYDVVGYHVVNILIHILTAIFLYFLVKATLEILEKRSSGGSVGVAYSAPVLAFCAVLIWFVHPVQTQSVSYIVQRMNSISSMFYILSMLLYVAGRCALKARVRWILLGGCVVSGVLAIGSKEIAATLPFFIFLYEWFFFQDLDRKWLKRNLLLFSAIAVVVVVIAVAYLGVHPFERILSGYDRRDFTMGQRVLTEFRAVMLYIAILIFPHPSRLNLDYDFPLSYSLINPATTLISIGITAGLVVLAVYLARKHRLLSFCILWFLGNLVIESSVIALELVYEHRLYLPSMFGVVLIVLLAARYIRLRWAAVGLLCAVVGIFSVWTFQRNGVWTDELSLWQDAVKKSPNKARPHLGLGSFMEENGKIEESIEQYALAIQLEPGYSTAYYSMGNAQKAAGNIDEAMKNYLTVLKIDPEDSYALNNIGVILVEKGELSQALEYFNRAKETEPFYIQGRYNIGHTLHRLGRMDEAITELSDVLKIDPGNAMVHYEMGNIYSKQGKTQKAIDHYLNALNFSVDYVEAHVDLGNILFLKGDMDEAAKQYFEALRINPELVEAHNNLGNIFIKRGEIDKAIIYYKNALSINPDHAGSNNGLGVALARKGDIEGAIGYFKEALRINPANIEILENLKSLQLMSPDTDASVAQILRELEADPNNAGIYIKLGDLYRSRGEEEVAIGYYRGALEVEEGHLTALSRLAMVYGSRGDEEKALEVLKEIVELRPDSAEAYYNIACIYSRQGRIEGSVEWLKGAVERGFNDWKLLKTDRDLENIRGESYYRGLVEEK